MKKIAFALLLSAGCVMVAACGGKSSGDGGDAKSSGGTAAAGDSVGVAECDDYIKKYEACIGKAAGPAKAAAQQGFDAQRQGFKSGAATPEGKAALKTQCKALVDGLASNPMCK